MKFNSSVPMRMFLRTDPFLQICNHFWFHQIGFSLSKKEREIGWSGIHVCPFGECFERKKFIRNASYMSSYSRSVWYEFYTFPQLLKIHTDLVLFLLCYLPAGNLFLDFNVSSYWNWPVRMVEFAHCLGLLHFQITLLTNFDFCMWGDIFWWSICHDFYVDNLASFFYSVLPLVSLPLLWWNETLVRVGWE